MAGLPIRLIRRDNKVIELDCTNYAMTVKRRVTPISLPLSGERLGYDLNQVESAIRLECILTDDDCGDTDFSVGKASGYIDFSTRIEFSGESIETLSYMSGDEGIVTRSNLDDTVITINAFPSSGTVADIINITLDSSASSHTHSSTGSGPATHSLTVGLNQSTDTGVASADTGAFIAETIKDAIEDFAPLTSLITPTVDRGSSDPVGTTGRLVITMANAGSVASFDDMVVEPGGDTAMPLVKNITDAEVTSCFSAGDKAQNLIGVAINNGVLGVVGNIHTGPTNIQLDQYDGVFDVLEAFGMENTQQDYIVGLQIPYNSFNGLTDVYGATEESVPQGYSARNFFYGTGIMNTAKGANDNTLVASTEFDVKNRFTGIRGTVLAVDIDYQAGETVYSATITFQPLDAWGSA